MKKIFAILLLSIFFLSQVGYHFAFTIINYNEQEKMEKHLLSTLPETACEIIDYTLEQDKINWKEKGEIFFLGDIMYDVVKIKKVSNGHLHLYCIKEAIELQMISELKLKLSSEQNSCHKFDLVFENDFFLPHTNDIFLQPYFSKSYTFYDSDLSYTWLGMTLPPPRNVTA